MSLPRGISRRILLGAALAPWLRAQQPYKQGTAVPYDPPGRAGAKPEGLSEVRLGFFGPDDPRHPLGGPLYMGVRLAVEDANARGGLRGVPFALVSRWSDDPWRGGAAACVKLAYTDRVWGILGGIDGASTHLALQIAAKALLPVVDPISTGETVNNAGVPWVFSLAPGDMEIARALASKLAPGPYGLIAGIDHDSRTLAQRFLKTVDRPPERRIEIGAPQEVSFEGATQWVLLAPPEQAAAAARNAPAGVRLLCGPSAGTRRFRTLAPEPCANIEIPLLPPLRTAFAARLQTKFGIAGDWQSELGYTGASLLMEALRGAGLNRALVRDWLAARFTPTGRGRIGDDETKTGCHTTARAQEV